MINLSGKSAFVTGGSSGIGLAISTLFKKLGARVIIADIVDCSEIANDIGVHYVNCNVSSEQSVQDSLSKAQDTVKSKLDIIVLNAGVGDVGFEFIETESGLVEKLTKINQWGVLYGLKHGPKALNDGGAILATSSMASKLSVPGCGVYSAGKRAINSMVATAALELGARNIRVNAVCPGYVDTALGDSSEEKRFSEVFTALGKHADPSKDIAPVFAFLASDAARYITGQSINVDGGMDLGPSNKLMELVTGSSKSPGSQS